MKLVLALMCSAILAGSSATVSGAPASAGDTRSKPGDWPAGCQEIDIPGASDGTVQKAMFFAPTGDGAPGPLVVVLHPWSSNYLYAAGIEIARQCAARGWAYIQPDFHGSNVRPEALGSKLVIADIASAVAYAQAHANIDRRRIYLVGASGGGHAALLAAGRLPGLFAAVSAWVPISDLTAWYQQTLGTAHKKYAENIAAACGGPPDIGSPAHREALDRSPVTFLGNARDTLFDINTGIHDGHGANSVPVSHSLLAFNLLARPEDRVQAADIERMVKEEAVPAELKFTGNDATYGERSVLFRKSSNGARVTVTDGKHEIVTAAAMAWLDEVNRTR